MLQISQRKELRKKRILLLSAIWLVLVGCGGATIGREQQSLKDKSHTNTVRILPSGAPVLDKRTLSQLAKKITLLVEGPGSPGSAVIFSKEGLKYFALTAWHVVKDVNPNEEIQVRTHDGRWHNVQKESLKKFEKADLAIFSFQSEYNYSVPEIGNPRILGAGADVYVSGFPLPSASVPKSVHRFMPGVVVAFSEMQQADGYDLLYSNPTLPGMSGGPVITDRGGLIGIHGRAETDFAATEQEGIAIKTGVNQAIPITYAIPVTSNTNSPAEINPSNESQELIAKAAQRIESLNSIKMSTHPSEWLNDQKKFKTGLMLAALGEQAIDLVTLAIQKQPNGYSYYLRGTYKEIVNLLSYNSFSRENIRQDYEKAVSLDHEIAPAYQRIGDLITEEEDPDGSLAISYYEKALAIDPFFESAYLSYGSKLSKGVAINDADTVKALEIYRRGLEKIPTSAELNYQVGRFILKRDEDRAHTLVMRWEKEAFDNGTFDFDDQAGQSERFMKKAEERVGLRKTREQVLDYFDSSLEIRPQDRHGNVREARSKTREDLGDYKGAISDITTYINSGVLNPSTYIHIRLVRLYEKIGNSEGVIRAVNKAMELKENNSLYMQVPDIAVFYLARAKAFKSSGQVQAACNDMSRYVANNWPPSLDLGSSNLPSWAQSCGIEAIPARLSR